MSGGEVNLGKILQKAVGYGLRLSNDNMLPIMKLYITPTEVANVLRISCLDPDDGHLHDNYPFPTLHFGWGETEYSSKLAAEVYSLADVKTFLSEALKAYNKTFPHVDCCAIRLSFNYREGNSKADKTALSHLRLSINLKNS